MSIVPYCCKFDRFSLARESVAYRVDEAGRDLLVELGRSNGKVGDFPACSTCTETEDDALLRGFRAEVTGL
jgi:hypothetical protein